MSTKLHFSQGFHCGLTSKDSYNLSVLSWVQSQAAPSYGYTLYQFLSVSKHEALQWITLNTKENYYVKKVIQGSLWYIIDTLNKKEKEKTKTENTKVKIWNDSCVIIITFSTLYLNASI